MSYYGSKILNLLTGTLAYLVAIHIVHTAVNVSQGNKLDQIIKTQKSIQLDLDALDTHQWMIMNKLDAMATDTLSNE